MVLTWLRILRGMKLCGLRCRSRFRRLRLLSTWRLLTLAGLMRLVLSGMSCDVLIISRADDLVVRGTWVRFGLILCLKMILRDRLSWILLTFPLGVLTRWMTL